ncbi:hypothetical protein TNIN_155921 [Trichonephila inaurata madagascariensis]|uniref:Uncharacterized protein n=1 Tax=Trichonephila inaurata madagascariensis TaxID=2747483 RepID=A0A8X6XKL6_9ARAC|nr:hypothetical protein TNIN_155921 [Trichonephila inaurata madagascariensis]
MLFSGRTFKGSVIREEKIVCVTEEVLSNQNERKGIIFLRDGKPSIGCLGPFEISALLGGSGIISSLQLRNLPKVERLYAKES